MPPVSIAPAPRVDPFGYANANAVKKILETIGQAEGQRQEQILKTNILEAISQGGEPTEIMTNIASIISQRQPQYDTGFQGVMQKIASRFAPPPSFENVVMGPLLKTALTPKKKTELQKLIDEGNTPEKAKLIRDISHGIKPRASSRKHYDNMSEVEKLDFLSKLKRRALGQYYGVEEGAEKAVDQRTLDWAEDELIKLPMFSAEESSAESAAEGPATVEDFEAEVLRLKNAGDMNKARAYYDKWVSKWQ